MKKIRVLVADDNELTNQILCEIIELDPGLELVGHAGDGETTIRLIRQLCPDVLLLDLIMPNMDGLDVLDSMREDHRNLAVIVVSSLEEKSMIDRAFSRGADYYLRKPVSADSVSKKIRQVYEERKAVLNPGAQMQGLRERESYYDYGSETALSAEPSREQKNQDLEKAVTEELYRLGMPVNLIGYQYLKQAIMILLNDPEAGSAVIHEIYENIANTSRVSSASVERAMRNAIKSTFERGNQTQINQVFNSSGEGAARRPSITVFITVIADRLRYNENVYSTI